MNNLWSRFQVRHQVAALSTLVLMVIPFQNCSGYKVGSGDNSSSSLSSSSPDQILQVTNVNKEVLASFQATSASSSETFYTAVNAASGRQAIVRVLLDQSSHAILGVEATGPSYFCFDPRQSLCANVLVPSGYPGAGTLAQNCSSPIYYTGAISGSIDNLNQDNQCLALTPAVPSATTTSLNVTNINNEIQGSFNSFSISGSVTKSLFTAVNPATGRSARLLVSVAPTTHEILGARPADSPYFCFDHTQQPCANVRIPAGYPNAGTVTPNCSSPIYLTGAVNGTINNLTANLICPGSTL